MVLQLGTQQITVWVASLTIWGISSIGGHISTHQPSLPRPALPPPCLRLESRTCALMHVPRTCRTALPSWVIFLIPQRPIFPLLQQMSYTQIGPLQSGTTVTLNLLSLNILSMKQRP